MRVDPKGFYLCWIDQNNETDILDIATIRDVRTGQFAKKPRVSFELNKWPFYFLPLAFVHNANTAETSKMFVNHSKSHPSTSIISNVYTYTLQVKISILFNSNCEWFSMCMELTWYTTLLWAMNASKSKSMSEPDDYVITFRRAPSRRFNVCLTNT